MSHKMLFILIGIIIAIVLLIGMYQYAYPKFITSKIEKEVAIVIKEKEERIKELNRRISVLSKQLDTSNKKYLDLQSKIRAKVEEARAIKEPETREETITRFTTLGYPPIQP